MNLNDYRLNAYKNAAGDSFNKSSDKNNINPSKNNQDEFLGRTVRRFNPEKLRYSSSEDDYPPVKHSQSVQRANKDYIAEEASAAASLRQTADRLASGGLLKVPSSAGVKKSDKAGNQESIYRRVAKFLLIIGVDEAAKILPHLSESQTEKIIPEIASIRQIDPDESAAILAEFQSLVQQARQNGGVDTAYSILEKAFGTQKASSMLKKALPDVGGKPFDYLDDIDGERLYLLLSDEGIAVQAIVLSRVKPTAAAAALNMFEPEIKKEIMIRLAKMKPIAPEILNRVDKTMHEKLDTINVSSSEKTDGRGALAEILKRMSPEAEQGILETLSAQDPDLGKDLRERMFTMEDLLSSDDRFIQGVLRNMEDVDVAYLIAGKDNAFRLKILSNVSKGRGDNILEEEQIRRPILKKDAERVTTKFFQEIRKAWEDGKLFVKGRDSDLYV